MSRGVVLKKKKIIYYNTVDADHKDDNIIITTKTGNKKTY